MTKVAVPPEAAALLAPLAEAARVQGAPLYAVGGPVRDWLLARPNFDLDLTVAGDPDPVARAAAALLGGKVEPFGRFGTRRIAADAKFRVDVATTREERYDAPAALPVVHATGVPIEKDLFRRDFTVNAMAVRLDDGSFALTDPYGGMKDLAAKVVRVLHPASFRDDPTRVFRAARFCARFGFAPAPGLETAAKDARPFAAKLSPHRRFHELLVLLAEKSPTAAFSRLAEWGYLPLLGFDAWPAGAPDGVDERLAHLALSMGTQKGLSFLDSFPVERALRGRLEAVLAVAFSRLSPRAPLDPFVEAAVRRFSPKLSVAALSPAFLTGADLLAAGLKPGPEMQKVLDESAALQRAGKLASREAALSWLATRCQA